MNYTVLDNAIVDKKIDDHMETIVTELKNILGKNLYAIILTGGFGRGEGSVLVCHDDTMKIVNDYDFEIVYNPAVSDLASKIYMKIKYTKALSALESKLAKAINIKQLDFTLRSLNDYQINTAPRLADFDTRYGHMFLYGNSNPAALMPEFKPKEIPPFEGSWLLRNRAIGLLLANFYLSRDITPDCQATDNFYIEVNKAILAMGDALFIINKTYHHSYQHRLNTIESLNSMSFSRIPEVIKLYKIAAEHKLRPKNNTFDNFSAEELWSHVTDLYLDLFLYHESKRQNTNFENIEKYLMSVTEKIKLPTKEVLRIIYELLLGNTKKSDIPIAMIIRNKNVNLGFTLSLLACLHDKKQTNLLNEIKKVSCEHEITCKEISKKYLLLSHPSGELKRFLHNI